jgi:ParB family chromosome partitioning protein
LEYIPAILREGLTGEEALLIVTETNLLQRSFADMTHSERAVTLSMHHEAIKRQGRRTALIREIESSAPVISMLLRVFRKLRKS